MFEFNYYSKSCRSEFIFKVERERMRDREREREMDTRLNGGIDIENDPFKPDPQPCFINMIFYLVRLHKNVLIM